MSQVHYRTIWISDTHLGDKNTQAEQLEDFLRNTSSDYLFLLGDIIDLWKMSKRAHWPTAHQQVLKVIFDKARNGTEVIYVPGNHDPFFKDFDGLNFGHISIEKEYIHTLKNSKRVLLIHGDQLDEKVECSRLLYRIGDMAYGTIVTLNRWLNGLRKRLGKKYWSLSGALKLKSKKAQCFIDRFEQQAVAYAKSKQVDGIFCGHIHQSKLTEIDGILYGNDGDWLESCSTIVESKDGELKLLKWSKGHQITGDITHSNDLIEYPHTT